MIKDKSHAHFVLCGEGEGRGRQNHSPSDYRAVSQIAQDHHGTMAAKLSYPFD
jgi:hypothetical protein